MNQEHSITSNEVKREAESEFTWIQILIVLFAHKKLIIRLPIAAAIISAFITFLLPEIYSANTKLLPPQQPQSGAAALLSQLGGMAGAVAGSAGLKNPNDLYIGMLKSRTIADSLIAKFDLKKVYETESQEKARKKLAEHTAISSGKDGLITIEFEDENKKLVASVTNSYVEQLLKLTKQLALTEASQRRMFFEQQLEAAKNNLANAELTFKRALDTSGVISVDADSRARVETVGRLRAQISAKEIEFQSIKAFVTPNNQAYKRSQEDLISLRAELAKLENGNAQGASEGGKQVGLESIKVLRDVKYYQMLYELLAKQYEAARLDEAKDASIIQVLDAAIEPERRIFPKRAVIIGVATALAFFAAVLLAVLADAKQRALRNPTSAGHWAELKRKLKTR